jgi:S2P endopeptidase
LSHDRKHEAGSCFIPKSSSLTSPENGWCIEPVPLFEDQTKQRCVSHASCDVSHEHDSLSSNAGWSASVPEKRRAQICITPHSSAALHRISFLMNAGDIREKTIVWKGPRREVWDQGVQTIAHQHKYLVDSVTVTVGKYLPRLRILPLALPVAVELLLECVGCVCPAC